MGATYSQLYSQFCVTPPIPTNCFTGQVIIVTGSNTGLGLEAARHFARLDAAKIILAVRSIEKGQLAKQSIEATTKCGPFVIEVWSLDLASYTSVKSFAARAATLPKLDLVVENAGLTTTKFKIAEDNEVLITVNVVSTILLAVMLIPLLQKNATDGKLSRLSIVTSGLHASTTLPERKADNTFDALNNETTADMKNRYAVSKLLQVFAVRELASLVQPSSVIINMVAPGLCHSELARDDHSWSLWLLKLCVARKTEVGSRTLVYAASSGVETHGKYLSDDRIADDMMSAFVQSKDGIYTQKKIWRELGDKLEKIQPGILNI